MKEEIEASFMLTDEGQLKYFLGMNIYRDGERGNVSIGQKQFIIDLLCKYNFLNCKSRCTPMETKLIFENSHETDL